MKKIKITKTIMLLLVIGIFSMSNVYAIDEKLEYTEKPNEEIRDGVLFIDGIPLVNDDFELNILNKTTESSYKLFQLASSAYPLNEWSKKNNSFIYKSYDRDSFINNSDNLSMDVKLVTSSFTEYSISGSTKFGFENIAEASMSGSIGESWGKTYNVSVTVPPKTEAELVSACQVMKTQWIYPDSTGGEIENYYGYSYNKYKTQYWLYEN